MTALGVHTERRSSGDSWSKAERELLRSRYPVGGVDYCIPLLPGRTATSIQTKANALGLRMTGNGRAAPHPAAIERAERALHDAAVSLADLAGRSHAWRACYAEADLLAEGRG